MSVDLPIDDSERSAARSASRLPKTNRADADSAGDGPSTVRISERDGTKMRAEGIETATDGARVGERWSDLREDWRAWFLDHEGSKTVFADLDGNTIGGDQVHSFKTEYQERQCARAHDLERELQDRWGTTLYTAMLTLTCSSTDDSGEWRPPLDQLNDLDASWESVRRELGRVMEDREWHRLAILEPHKSGYTHIHIGVFSRGPIREERFESVIDAHVRNSPGAEADAHDDAIDVLHSGDPAAPGGVESLGAYLTAYMTQNYGESALEAPEYLQRWYALMWAAPVQRYRPSQGAQEMMAYDGDGVEEPSEWQFVGIAPDGNLDDVRECPPDAGGVEYDRVRPPPSRRSRQKPPPNG